MPDEPQDISVDERKALIAKMLASEAFRGSENMPKLLRFLFENSDKLLAAKDIEGLHYKRTERHFSPSHAREQISELKKRLNRYEIENPEDQIRCELPNADDIGGYKLGFRRLNEPISARRCFWEAHLDSDKEVVVVCDPLLFYWDHGKGAMVRFMDTNIEGLSRKAALEELKRLHKKEHKDTLIPGHFYIDVGSVIAADLVRDYFGSAGIQVPLVLDKQIHRQWLKASPIVIGTVRTNSAMRSITGSVAGKGLAYRLRDSKFAWININDPNKEELEALNSINTQVDSQGNFLTPSAELTIGIVTRIPNPRGAGVMTFVSSDGTFTTKQMVAALTDETQLRVMFAQMGWRLDRPVPDTFEMMFLVQLWPGDIDDEGSEAKLMCWRPRPDAN